MNVRLSPDDCYKLLKELERKPIVKLPPFVYVLAFWQALANLLAAVLAMLLFFQVIPPGFAFGAAAILAAFLAILKAFQINPQIQAWKLRNKVRDFPIKPQGDR